MNENFDELHLFDFLLGFFPGVFYEPRGVFSTGFGGNVVRSSMKPIMKEIHNTTSFQKNTYKNDKTTKGIKVTTWKT